MGKRGHCGIKPLPSFFPHSCPPARYHRVLYQKLLSGHPRPHSRNLHGSDRKWPFFLGPREIAISSTAQSYSSCLRRLAWCTNTFPCLKHSLNSRALWMGLTGRNSNFLTFSLFRPLILKIGVLDKTACFLVNTQQKQCIFQPLY